MRAGALISVALLTGCVAAPPARKELTADVWSQPGSVAVLITGLNGQEYRVSEGALMALIDAPAAAESRLKPYLQAKRIDCPEAFRGVINDSLVRKGWKPVDAGGTVTEDSLPEYAPRDSSHAGRDYRGLAASTGADRVLSIRTAYAGTISEHRLFEKAGAPRVFVVREVQLIDLKSNALLWNKSYKNERMVTIDPQQPDGPEKIGRELDVVSANNCVQIAQALAETGSGTTP